VPILHGPPALPTRRARSGGKDRRDLRAATELAEVQRLRGEDSWSNLARFRADTRYEAPSIRFLAEATIFDGLRKAGMPEERMPPARSAEEGSQPPLITAISPTPSTAVRNETDS
jgi:hypothetical protein